MADIYKLITLTEKNDAGPYFDVFYSADCLSFTQSVDGNNVYLPNVGSTVVVTVPDTTDCIKLQSIPEPCDNFVISGSNAPTTTTTTSTTAQPTTTTTTSTTSPTTTTTTSTTVLARYWNTTYCDGGGNGPTVQDSTAGLESGAVVKFAGGGEEFCVTLTTENFSPFIWFPIVTGDFVTCVACLPATTTTTSTSTSTSTSTTTSTTVAPTTTTTTSTTVAPTTTTTTSTTAASSCNVNVGYTFSIFTICDEPETTPITMYHLGVCDICGATSIDASFVSGMSINDVVQVKYQGVYMPFQKQSAGTVAVSVGSCLVCSTTTTTTTTSTTVAPTTTTTTSTTAPLGCFTYSVQNDSLSQNASIDYTDCNGNPVNDVIIPADSGTPDFCAEEGSITVNYGNVVITLEATTCTVSPTTTTTSTTVAPTTTTTTSTTAQVCNCLTVDVLNTQLTNGGLDLYYILNDCGGGSRDVNLAQTIGTEIGGSTYFALCGNPTLSNLFKYGPSGSPFVGEPGMNVNGSGTVCNVDGDCLPVTPTTTTTTSTTSGTTTSTTTTTTIQNCVTNFGAGMVPCFGGTVDDYMEAEVTLQNNVSVDTTFTMRVYYIPGTPFGNCNNTQSTIDIDVTVPAGQNTYLVTCGEAPFIDAGGATICSFELINPPFPLCTPTTTTTTSTTVAPTTTTTTSTTLANGVLWSLFCPSQGAAGGCGYTFTKLDGTLCSDTVPPDTDTDFCVKAGTTPFTSDGVWTEIGDPCAFNSCLENP